MFINKKIYSKVYMEYKGAGKHKTGDMVMLKNGTCAKVQKNGQLKFAACKGKKSAGSSDADRRAILLANAKLANKRRLQKAAAKKAAKMKTRHNKAASPKKTSYNKAVSPKKVSPKKAASPKKMSPNKQSPVKNEELGFFGGIFKYFGF